jgi:hypothetical protein
MVVEEAPEEAQEYPVKRGHKADTDLAEVMRDAFEEAKQIEDREAKHDPDTWYKASFGHINQVEARYYKKSSLWVINDQRAPEDIDFQDDEEMRIANETRDAWNKFLQDATGYTAKERSKKMKEKAKDN